MVFSGSCGVFILEEMTAVCLRDFCAESRRTAAWPFELGYSCDFGIHYYKVCFQQARRIQHETATGKRRGVIFGSSRTQFSQ
jgi:hypothetical protein